MGLVIKSRNRTQTVHVPLVLHALASCALGTASLTIAL